MAELSDGFLALAGGLGTLEELAEVLSWAQLELHRKPVGILDPVGYWAELLAFLDGAVREEFLAPAQRKLLMVAEELDDLLERFDDYRPGAGRWS
jgi:uncharacterized protein (TIGR00730 family)